jgi:RluA family pseudouridine synthase
MARKEPRGELITKTVSRGWSGTLVQYLAEQLSISKKKAKALIDGKNVFLNGRRVWIASYELHGGEVIEIAHVAARTQERVRADQSPIEILFQDDSFIIVNKPPGILSNGDDSLELRLRAQLNIPSVYAVHRLDRDTTGCNLFATSKKIKESCEEIFKTKQVTKRYYALVAGKFPLDLEEISSPLDGKKALTKIEIVGVGDRATLLAVQIVTGRMHQIRRHLAATRHPVIGDREYGASPHMSKDMLAAPRQLLHAYSFSMPVPENREVQQKPRIISAIAPFPDDFSSWLRRFEMPEPS